MGARVIACASSDDKLAFAREHGADDGINYASRRSARRRCGALTGGNGVDVIYDPVGGALRAKRRCARIAWDGRYLVIGFAAGDIPKLPLNLVLLQQLRRARRVLGRVDRSATRKATAPT